MIVLWILLGIVALITLLLLLPMRVFIAYSPQSDLVLYAKYLFLKLEMAEEPNLKLRQQILGILGLSDIKSAASVKRAVDAKGISTTFFELVSVIKMLLGRIGWLLKRGIFRRFDLQIISGGTDAAETAFGYGQICAAVYPFIGLLDTAFRFRRRNIDIRCDYAAEETSMSISLQFNVRLGLVLRALIHVIREHVKRALEQEGRKT